MADNPLSPHLQVYKPQLTSILSISHRISGVFLTLGTVVLLYWLVSAALGEQAYNQARATLGMPLVQLILFGWTYAFFFHLCSGLRHLVFDSGHGLDIDTAYKNRLPRTGRLGHPDSAHLGLCADTGRCDMSLRSDFG